MNSVANEYKALLQSFLAGEVHTAEFQLLFLEKFKNEERWLEEKEFGVLDELFGDVDSFSNDPELLRRSPGFYLDETALRLKVEGAVQRLGSLKD
jgi:hypothetical protein